MQVKLYNQYSNAPNWQILQLLCDYLDIGIADFYRYFFNIDTCSTQGLDNWGLILNQSRIVQSYDYTSVFGFDLNPLSPTIYPQNFEHGSFFSSSNNLITISLDDYSYRNLLKLTYQKQTCNNSVEACVRVVNTYIQNQYPSQGYKCDIIEGVNHFTYAFNYALSSWEQGLFVLNDALPRPAGISYNVTWKGN